MKPMARQREHWCWSSGHSVDHTCSARHIDWKHQRRRCRWRRNYRRPRLHRGPTYRSRCRLRCAVRHLPSGGATPGRHAKQSQIAPTATRPPSGATVRAPAFGSWQNKRNIERSRHWKSERGQEFRESDGRDSSRDSNCTTCSGANNCHLQRTCDADVTLQLLSHRNAQGSGVELFPSCVALVSQVLNLFRCRFDRSAFGQFVNRVVTRCADVAGLGSHPTASIAVASSLERC